MRRWYLLCRSNYTRTTLNFISAARFFENYKLFNSSHKYNTNLLGIRYIIMMSYVTLCYRYGDVANWDTFLRAAQHWCSNPVGGVTAACESDGWDLEIPWLRTLLRGGLAQAKTQAQHTNLNILLGRKQPLLCAPVLLIKWSGPFRATVRVDHICMNCV